MFHDLDGVLRQLLVRELPVKNNEIDIVFDQPKREWSARLNKPALNIFLYDVRENIKLRQSQQWMIEHNKDGTVIQRRTPTRVDLHYMVTAWANDPEDEHNLLARTLMVLFREPHLPKDLLPESLQDQPVPIALQVAQEGTLTNPADVWSAMDNEFRPAIVLTVTLTVDPYQPLVTPVVRSRDLRFGQSRQPAQERLIEEAEPEVFWTIGGSIQTDKPLQELSLTLVERGQAVPLQEEGRFAIGRLKAGDYTLEITIKGGKPKRHKISVPAPDYDLKV